MPWMFKCWDISKNRIHAVLLKTKLKYENNICVSTPSKLQRQKQIKKKSPEKNSTWAEVDTYQYLWTGGLIDIQLGDISEVLCAL